MCHFGRVEVDGWVGSGRVIWLVGCAWCEQDYAC
jgi:hypothetical protein